MNKNGSISRIFEHSSICAGSYRNFNLQDEEASWSSLHSTILAGNVDERLTGPTDSLFLSTLEEQDENSDLNVFNREIYKKNLKPVEPSNAVLASDEEAYYDCSEETANMIPTTDEPFDAFNTTKDSTVGHMIVFAKGLRCRSSVNNQSTVKNYNLESKFEEHMTDLNNNNSSLESKNKTKSECDENFSTPKKLKKKSKISSTPKVLSSKLKRRVNNSAKPKVQFKDSEITSSMTIKGNCSSCPDLKQVLVSTPKVRFTRSDSVNSIAQEDSRSYYNLKLNAGVTPKIITSKESNSNVNDLNSRGSTSKTISLRDENTAYVKPKIPPKSVSRQDSRVKKLKELFETKHYAEKKKDSSKVLVVDTHVTLRKPYKKCSPQKNVVRNGMEISKPKLLSPRSLDKYPSSDMAYGTGSSDLSSENSLRRSSSLNDFLEEEDTCEIYNKVKKHLLERKESNQLTRVKISSGHPFKQSLKADIRNDNVKQSQIINRKSIGFVHSPIKSVSELRRLFSPRYRGDQKKTSELIQPVKKKLPEVVVSRPK